jgi:hypothetical protein
MSKLPVISCFAAVKAFFRHGFTIGKPEVMPSWKNMAWMFFLTILDISGLIR